MFDVAVSEGVLRVRRPGTRWLSTGADGGFHRAPAAYNVSVPDGWDREDLATYFTERRERAGFDDPGPALLTGVELQHARGARLGPVEAVATAGVSNPAALPVDSPWGGADADQADGDPTDGEPDRHHTDGPDAPAGTVNLLVGTSRALYDAALANLVAVVAEAKAATLLATTGFPGTTTDAVVVGTAPDGEPVTFSGSATPVGEAARACVRESVAASLASRYADRPVPSSVADAEHGVVTHQRAEVFTP